MPRSSICAPVGGTDGHLRPEDLANEQNRSACSRKQGCGQRGQPHGLNVAGLVSMLREHKPFRAGKHVPFIANK
jgi:hypothetical protein